MHQLDFELQHVSASGMLLVPPLTLSSLHSLSEWASLMQDQEVVDVIPLVVSAIINQSNQIRRNLRTDSASIVSVFATNRIRSPITAAARSASRLDGDDSDKKRSSSPIRASANLRSSTNASSTGRIEKASCGGGRLPQMSVASRTPDQQ